MQTNTNQKQQKYILLILLLTVLSIGLLRVNAAQAQNIDYVDAVFTVEYNNKLTQGENHLHIQRDNNQYQIDFNLEHWLLSSNQKATFEMNQSCEVKPLSYISTSKRPLKNESIQRLAFDWSTKKAEFNDEKEQKFFDLEDTLYDPLSFFIEARCELMAGKTEFSYPLIYKGNKKTHNYQVVGTEMVATGLGEVEALVIERDRKSDSRQTRLYVAPSLDYLLVKIEHQESRLLKIVATLKNMNYKILKD